MFPVSPVFLGVILEGAPLSDVAELYRMPCAKVAPVVFCNALQKLPQANYRRDVRMCNNYSLNLCFANRRKDNQTTKIHSATYKFIQTLSSMHPYENPVLR